MIATGQNSETPGLFVTGSDTGVGKTYVACCIVESLLKQRLKVGVYKPVASGCRRENGELIADDAVRLSKAAGRPGTLDEVCPQRFEAPLAPHLAARSEGKSVDTKRLRRGLEVWRKRSDFVLVEGAGGLLSPTSDTDLAADLAGDFRYPLVIVVRNTLGAINQALLTARCATEILRLPVASVVLNEVDVDDDPSRELNLPELQRLCPLPVARLRYCATDFDPKLTWMRSE